MTLILRIFKLISAECAENILINLRMRVKKKAALSDSLFS